MAEKDNGEAQHVPEELRAEAPTLNMEIEYPPKRPKSWLSWFSGYVRMLEYEVEAKEFEAKRLRAERDSIFDRLVRLTTGFGMEEEMPDAIEVEKRTQEVQRPARTMHDFRSQMTAESLERYEERIKRDAEADEKARRDAAEKKSGGKSGDNTTAKAAD